METKQIEIVETLFINTGTGKYYKGDTVQRNEPSTYMHGRIGTIVDLDAQKFRARVTWTKHTKEIPMNKPITTWVKLSRIVVLQLLFCFALASCGTVTQLSTPADACQRCRPEPGQPKRQLRVFPFVADLLLMPFTGGYGLLLDFGNGKIYKRCPNASPRQ